MGRPQPELDQTVWVVEIANAQIIREFVDSESLAGSGTAGKSNIESVQSNRLPNASPQAASASRATYQT